MAMLPFCGYNMGNYFQHWIAMRRRIAHPPRIFHVNWFRKDTDGSYLWPGFGDNMRVLKWIVDRCLGRAVGMETPLGWVPAHGELDLTGLADYTQERLDKAMAIHHDEWIHELHLQDELFMKLHSTLPKELIFERELLAART
jgi:phosphoenolpyruvate carboxykinase (GTP)